MLLCTLHCPIPPTLFLPLQTLARTAWRRVTVMPSSPTAQPTRPRAPMCVKRPTVPLQRVNVMPRPATVLWIWCWAMMAAVSSPATATVVWRSRAPSWPLDQWYRLTSVRLGESEAATDLRGYSNRDVTPLRSEYNYQKYTCLNNIWATLKLHLINTLVAHHVSFKYI